MISICEPGDLAAPKRPEQVEENVKATMLSALDPNTMSRIHGVYDELIRPQIHARY